MLPHGETTDVVALTVPEGSTFTVGCKLRSLADDPRTLAKARVTALQVGAIN